MNSNSKLPKKIIFASTISVYGENINKTEYLESDELNPTSPYAVSKPKAEEYLNKNFADRCWILGLHLVYGKDFSLNIDRRTKINEYFYKVGDGQKNCLYVISKIYTMLLKAYLMVQYLQTPIIFQIPSNIVTMIYF